MPATTPAERTRAQLRSLAAAGLDAHTFADSAIDLVQRAVPFDAACTAGLDPATFLVTHTFKLEIDDDHDHEWAHYEYELDGVVATFMDLAQRAQKVTTVELETDGDVARCERLSGFLRPNFGIGHELRAAMAADGAVWGGMCLFREEGVAAGFSAAEVDFVASISESFALGLRMGLVAGAVGDACTSSGPSVLIVGADDELAQISPGAEQRLAELGSGPGTVSWDRLPMHLLSLVSAARAFARGRLSAPPRLRVRSATGQWMVAHASTLADRNGLAGSVVVTIEEARPPEIVPLVVAAFGLSPREQDVVRLVLQGVDTAQIARTLHLSAYTVQDHLKSIFTKAGVRSRRELTAKVFFDQYASRLGASVGPDGWFAADAPVASPIPPTAAPASG